MATEAARRRAGPPVTDLVTRAAGGDTQAWDALVERYIPLVWSICRRHQLNRANARDVSQAVWQQLASELGTLRNTTALARWLAATTQRECDRIRHGGPGPGQRPPAASISAEQTPIAEQDLLVAGRDAALREAFAHLPPHCQRLIAMLIQDPPVPDAEISATLGIPAPSIRRNCHSCLQKLRGHPAITALLHAETKTTRSEAAEEAAAR